MDAAHICVKQSETQSDHDIVCSGRTHDWYQTSATLYHFSTSKLTLVFHPHFNRSLIHNIDSNPPYGLEWSDWDGRRYCGLTNLHGDSPEACIIETGAPDGGLHFFARVVNENDPHAEIDGEDHRTYGIAHCLLNRASGQHQAIQHLAFESNISVAPHLLPHPSRPLIFAFTPAKIIVIYSCQTVETPCAFACIDLHVPAVSAPSPGAAAAAAYDVVLVFSVLLLLVLQALNKSSRWYLGPCCFCKSFGWVFWQQVKQFVIMQMHPLPNTLSRPPSNRPLRNTPPKLSPVFDGALSSASCIQQVRPPAHHVIHHHFDDNCIP